MLFCDFGLLELACEFRFWCGDLFVLLVSCGFVVCFGMLVVGLVGCGCGWVVGLGVALCFVCFTGVGLLIVL